MDFEVSPLGTQAILAKIREASPCPLCRAIIPYLVPQHLKLGYHSPGCELMAYFAQGEPAPSVKPLEAPSSHHSKGGATLPFPKRRK